MDKKLTSAKVYKPTASFITKTKVIKTASQIKHNIITDYTFHAHLVHFLRSVWYKVKLWHVYIALRVQPKLRGSKGTERYLRWKHRIIIIYNVPYSYWLLCIHGTGDYQSLGFASPLICRVSRSCGLLRMLRSIETSWRRRTSLLTSELLTYITGTEKWLQCFKMWK